MRCRVYWVVSSIRSAMRTDGTTYRAQYSRAKLPTPGNRTLIDADLTLAGDFTSNAFAAALVDYLGKHGATQRARVDASSSRSLARQGFPYSLVASARDSAPSLGCSRKRATSSANCSASSTMARWPAPGNFFTTTGAPVMNCAN